MNEADMYKEVMDHNRHLFLEIKENEKKLRDLQNHLLFVMWRRGTISFKEAQSEFKLKGDKND